MKFMLIVINLYPFTQTIGSGAEFTECIEQIDIGGPSMLRGAAKNHNSVAVISDPSQYSLLNSALEQGGFTLEERRNLAMNTFRKTAEYDIAIADWLANELNQSDWRAKVWHKVADLRYGENPHQSAAVFADISSTKGISSAKQHHGKEMSFNNFTDADAALRAAYDHSQPCVAIIKHANPCGMAVAKTIETAYQRALDCDPTSAFGGIVALNRSVDTPVAEQIIDLFTEVVIAPEFTPGALTLLHTKKNMRIIAAEQPSGGHLHMRSIDGGFLVQDIDVVETPVETWQVVTTTAPTEEQLADAVVAWVACASVSSNAITLVRNGQTVGIGGGQQNRVDAARLACVRAGDRAHGAVAASDAFFPFRDGPDVLAQHGVSVIVQPGGSQRDEEVISAANEHGMVMIFTGTRHFRH